MYTQLPESLHHISHQTMTSGQKSVSLSQLMDDALDDGCMMESCTHWPHLLLSSNTDCLCVLRVKFVHSSPPSWAVCAIPIGVYTLHDQIHQRQFPQRG